jgi:hypothetical protein
MTSGFSPGSLVRARGRDWIVLPDPEPSVIRLRPLTSSLADEIGLFLPLEGPQISSAEFSPPGPEHPEVEQLIARVTERGFLTRACVAVVAPVPSWLPPLPLDG